MTPPRDDFHPIGDIAAERRARELRCDRPDETNELLDFMAAVVNALDPLVQVAVSFTLETRRVADALEEQNRLIAARRAAGGPNDV